MNGAYSSPHLSLTFTPLQRLSFCSAAFPRQRLDLLPDLPRAIHSVLNSINTLFRHSIMYCYLVPGLSDIYEFAFLRALLPARSRA
jgi:hypothetical protein